MQRNGFNAGNNSVLFVRSPPPGGTNYDNTAAVTADSKSASKPAANAGGYSQVNKLLKQAVRTKAPSAKPDASAPRLPKRNDLARQQSKFDVVVLSGTADEEITKALVSKLSVEGPYTDPLTVLSVVQCFQTGTTETQVIEAIECATMVVALVSGAVISGFMDTATRDDDLLFALEKALTVREARSRSNFVPVMLATQADGSPSNVLSVAAQLPSSQSANRRCTMSAYAVLDQVRRAYK